MVYTRRTLYFLWTHFHVECVFHFPVRTTEGAKTTLSSVLTGLLGQEGQHLSREDGVDGWVSCLGVGMQSPLSLPPGVKETGLLYPAESAHGFLANTQAAV